MFNNWVEKNSENLTISPHKPALAHALVLGYPSFYDPPRNSMNTSSVDLGSSDPWCVCICQTCKCQMRTLCPTMWKAHQLIHPRGM